MKKILLSLFAVVAIVLVTCGNEPPEEFFEGTPADDSAIIKVLEQNAILLNTYDQFVTAYIPTAMDTCVFKMEDMYFREDSTIIKQHINSSALRLSDTTRFRDLWYAKDTTCTVYLWDTFTIISEYHWDIRYTGLYFYPPGDTDRIIDTILVDTTGGDDSTDNVAAEGLKHIFFEPKREAKVDPETGDTLYPIKEPREWVLKKVSYGMYYFPNKGTERPTISTIYLTHGGITDSILYTNVDTTYTGHVMNRFRNVDSLFEFTTGESISVSLKVTGTIADSVCLFFATCNGNRKQLVNATGKVPISGKGIVNLYFTAVLESYYYYKKPEKPYVATVWLIPIRVK